MVGFVIVVLYGFVFACCITALHCVYVRHSVCCGDYVTSTSRVIDHVQSSVGDYQYWWFASH